MSKIRAVNQQKRLDAAQAEIRRLRTALEPFGRNVGAKSLVEALGHITREDMERAKELGDVAP